MADRGDSSLTVSAYSQRFFQSYSDSIEPSGENAKNKQLAGQTLINLVKKLHEAGSKDDIKVPLRVLRDEIGRIYFGSVQQRDLRIEKLFQLYDALEEGAQEEVRTKSSKESAWAQAALEELRQRFSRLVIGDTWETYPELKLKALQHLYVYLTKEKAEKQSISSTPVRQGPALSTNRLGMKKLSRSFSGTPQTSSTWQSTFDDLGKAPGNRLLPLLKLLLSAGLPAPEAALEASTEATPPDAPQEPVASPHTPESQNKASGVSDGAVGRPMSELDINMDDLLGLNDKAFETTKPEDPFGVSIEEPRPVTTNNSPGGYQNQQISPHSEPTRQSIGSNPELSSQAKPQQSQAAASPVPAYNPVAPQRQQRLQNGTPLPYARQPHVPQQFAPQQYPAQTFAGHIPGTSSGGGEGPRDTSFNRQPSNTYSNYNPADPNFHSQSQVSHGNYNTGPPIASAGSGGFGQVAPQLGPIGTAGSTPGTFNPFDLPSPTFASPVPKHVDNSFAEFSPIAGAPPQPKIPNPMRNAPEPPNQGISPPTQGGLQPPRSSFSSW